MSLETAFILSLIFNVCTFALCGVICAIHVKEREDYFGSYVRQQIVERAHVSPPNVTHIHCTRDEFMSHVKDAERYGTHPGFAGGEIFREDKEDV